MTSKRQLTLHLDADIARVLDLEATRRGLTLSRAANDALRRALIDQAVTCPRIFGPAIA